MEFDASRHGSTKENCFATFYMKAVQNNFRTENEGRPIFDEVEYVHILVPGGTLATTDVHRASKQEDRDRFPREYAAFKRGEETPMDGTPITEWAAISRSQAEELRALNIRTVETLANLDDLTLSKVVRMGGSQLRQKAQAFLDQAKGLAPITALQAENAALKAQAEIDRAAIDALSSRLADLEARQKEAA